MEIKTKFNLGDTIVGIKNHKLIEFKITSIVTGHYIMDGEEIYHSVTYSGKEAVPFNENNCFASREEYINQL